MELSEWVDGWEARFCLVAAEITALLRSTSKLVVCLVIPS